MFVVHLGPTSLTTKITIALNRTFFTLLLRYKAQRTMAYFTYFSSFLKVMKPFFLMNKSHKAWDRKYKTNPLKQMQAHVCLFPSTNITTCFSMQKHCLVALTINFFLVHFFFNNFLIAGATSETKGPQESEKNQWPNSVSIHWLINFLIFFYTRKKLYFSLI